MIRVPDKMKQNRLLRRATAAVVLAVLLSVVGGGTAAAQTDIGSCTSVSSSGSYEVPDRIDTAVPGFCVDVDTGDVVIDGKGNVINGTGAPGSVGLNVQPPSPTNPISNITVRNLTVTNFETGVNIEGAEEAELIDVETSSTNTSM